MKRRVKERYIGRVLCFILCNEKINRKEKKSGIITSLLFYIYYFYGKTVMVHQLSLVSSIPHNKYLQTISTLQALTGLIQPGLHQAFKVQIEQYYMRCITTWNSDKQEMMGRLKRDSIFWNRL